MKSASPRSRAVGEVVEGGSPETKFSAGDSHVVASLRAATASSVTRACPLFATHKAERNPRESDGPVLRLVCSNYSHITRISGTLSLDSLDRPSRRAIWLTELSLRIRLIVHNADGTDWEQWQFLALTPLQIQIPIRP